MPFACDVEKEKKNTKLCQSWRSRVYATPFNISLARARLRGERLQLSRFSSRRRVGEIVQKRVTCEILLEGMRAHAGASESERVRMHKNGGYVSTHRRALAD